MKLTVLLAALAGPAFLWSAAALAGPQLIVDGTFADGTSTDWSGFQTQNGMPDAIEVLPSATYGLPEYNGNVYNLEVNANYIDTVVQTVTGLIVGDYYSLTFGYGDRAGSGPQQLDVSFGGQLLAIDSYNGTDPAVWTTNSFLIEATATSEVLSFASQDVGGLPSYGNEISDVSLISEPASLAALIAGLTAIAVVRRRQA